MLNITRPAWALIFLCLAGCASLPTTAPSTAPAPAALKVTNATAAFFTFWDANQDKPEAERVNQFMAQVVAPYPQLFGKGVRRQGALVGEGASAKAREVVAWYLNEVKPYVPRMRDISNSIDRDFAGYAKNFASTFPDFAPRTPVYFTISLFDFDGGTRTVDGQTLLLFGIDGMARFHPADENLKVLFDHELFHQYHDQLWPEGSPDNAPLWMALWEEGLATYVSQQMNPDASEGQVLLKRDLATRAQPLLPKLARELLDNFDSADRKQYAAFFYGNNGRTDIPPRSGYYVGLRVAQILGSTRSLQQLAVMRGPALELAIRQALTQLASAS